MKAVQPADRRTVTKLAKGIRKSDAWLAGGTSLFKEHRPNVRRIIDLLALNWEPLVASEQGLSIAATCDLGTLATYRAPAAWQAVSLIEPCCDAFPATFVNWPMATVGGNLCMALPSGPMIALCTALEGVCTIWTPAGGERRLSVPDFVRAAQLPALRSGEILRSIKLPAEALKRQTAFRRLSFTPGGPSDALLIGSLTEAGDMALTITASTRRPLYLRFDGIPSHAALEERLAKSIPAELYYDDCHGRPDWCQHVTLDLAADICEELQASMPLRAFLSVASRSVTSRNPLAGSGKEGMALR